MSKIALSPNASGTGTLTIAAPNTNSDRTLTLPDNSGTVLTSASNLAGVTGVGKVLQVVQTVSTATFSTSSTSFVATGHAASITPSSATSKIFIIYGGFWCIQAANTEVALTVRSNQGATNLGYSSFYSATASGFTCAPQNLSFLDSPATTSALTYTVHAREGGLAGTVSTGAEQKTLTLLEIA